MAARKPLKNNAGALEEFASGDTIAPAVLGTGSPDGTKFLRDDGVFASPGASSTSIDEVEINLGAAWRTSGKVNVVDALVSGATDIIVTLAAGPYTGKGTRADEAEMYPGMTFAAKSLAGSFDVYWSAPQRASGNIKIKYLRG